MPFNITIHCCNRLFGEGIRRLIEDEPDIRVTVNDADPAKVTKIKTDLLIADLDILHSISLDTLFENRVPILLLGTEFLPDVKGEALSALVSKGLVGILSPAADASELKKAIKAVLSGEFWLRRKKVRRIFSGMDSVSAGKGPPLTMKEAEIVKMICQGYRNKQISQVLDISEQCTKSHLTRIYRKTGVSGRLQLALHAVRQSDLVSQV